MSNDRPIGRLRALGALVALLAVVVGAPAAILTVFGWPLTSGALDVRRWPSALTATELSDDAIVRVFVTLALVVLAYLIGCAGAEAVALVRRTERRVRSHNPLSQWVRHLVAVSAVLLTTARPVASLPPSGPQPAATVAAAVTPAPTGTPAAGGWHGLPDAREGLAVRDGRLADARDVRANTRTVEAGRRDSLYSLAVRHLGDGERRHELLALNLGRAMPDGSRFDGTVRPGFPILVPDSADDAAPPNAAAPPAAAVERTYTVVPGDSLWSIADRLLGDGAAHDRIHRANLGREVAPGVAYLSTTAVIRPGWVLLVPDDAKPPVDAGTHIVVPGDSLWSIAQDLRGGEGAAPSEVADYVARTVELNDDRLVRPGHPELLHPGQELLLPPTALPPPAAQPGAAAEASADVGPAVPAGLDHVPVDPASAVGDPPPAVAVPRDTPAVALPLGGPRSVGPSTPVDPAVVAIGAAALPPPTVAAGGGVEAARSVLDDRDRTAPDDSDGAGLSLPGLSLPGLAGAGVLAAGALGVVLRLRHQRLNRRRPGTRVEGPDDDVALVERVLRAQAEVELARWGPLALRQLAPCLGAEADGSFPMVAEVHLRRDGLTVRWSAPRPAAVPPWRASVDGTTWDLERSLSGADPDVPDGVVPPCPGLVTVGLRDGAPLLLDIESAGLVSVTGAPDRVAAFGRAAVLELAVSDFADLLDIRLVGLPDDGFEHLGRVHAVSALDQALSWARPVRRAADELLDEQGVRTLFEQRARQAATAVTHEPLVLVVAPGLLDHEASAELRRLCEPGRGVVAIVLGDVAAPVRVALGDDGRADVVWAARPAERALDAAPALPAATLAAVGALLAHAAEAPAHAVPTPLPVRRGGPFVESEAAMEVRLLGPVAVGAPGGADLEGVPARTLEVIAWLATHAAVEAGARIRADLWPGREGGARALNQQLTAARTLLGADAAGRLLLPTSNDDRYGLSEAVVTDVARLERRLLWASGAPDTLAVPVLRAGLTLVRGRPFTARSGYGWAAADQLAFGAEQLVVDAAHRLGTLALALGDPAGAVWATGAGLLGRPGDETLYQLRMRAFARMGNQASVRQAMNQLCSELQDLAGIDEPSDETTELFERLMGRERSA